jgi:alkylation response protein AidB-like acyl-CoA dehydrogenase
MAGEEAGYSGGIAARLLTKDWQTCAVIAGKNTTEAQKDWFFEKFMKNPVGLCAHCQSEPGGTTDILLPYDEPGVALKVTAHKDGDDWVINGDKMFSSGGGISEFIFTAARTDKNGPVSKSTTLFWVTKDTPGLSHEMNRLIIGDVFGNCQTHFDNVRVPECQLIGEVNKGYALLEDLVGTKMGAFSHSLGAAQKLYEQVVEYARQRVQGGKPIIQHSHIAALLGEIALNLESTRAFMYRAAWETDQTELAGAPRNVFWSVGCFYLIKMLGLRLSEVAYEVYGGIGGSVDLPLATYIRHCYMILPGGESPNMNKIKCSMAYNNHTMGTPWEKKE